MTSAEVNSNVIIDARHGEDDGGGDDDNMAKMTMLWGSSLSRK